MTDIPPPEKEVQKLGLFTVNQIGCTASTIHSKPRAGTQAAAPTTFAPNALARRRLGLMFRDILWYVHPGCTL
jgi:hypothetical protein